MEDLPQEFVDRLARVNKLVATQRTLPAKLEAVVAMAKRTIPTCDAAGVSLLIQGEPTTVAMSERVVVEIDLVQYQTGTGPCLSAMREGNVVRIDLLEKDLRFTRFAPGAVDIGVNSVLSLPLQASGEAVGSLNLYSWLEHAFDDSTVEAAGPLVEYAAEIVAGSPLYAYSLDMVEGLVEALEDQATIAQGLGWMMASRSCGEAEALEWLRATALSKGQSMRMAAAEVLQERAGDGHARAKGDGSDRP
ncbi:MAG: GAF and ANTAR domain-containing protein [Actinobacteria bacterium]|nr:GAF and ANTAR domain-containing protein [Actinomycetota bacterium]MBW3650146.1 GAF and ANTAR domain-containing protein [Actinomycetota bacterium]